jgi:hypothetical protein
LPKFYHCTKELYYEGNCGIYLPVFAGCETDFKEIIEKNDFFSYYEGNSANKEENSEKEILAGAENKEVDKKGEKAEATQNAVRLPNENINFGKAEGMDQQIRVLQNQVAALEEKNQNIIRKHEAALSMILRKHKKDLARMRQEVVKADAAGYQRGIDEMLARRAKAKGAPPSE